jgi:phosphoglycolate phosphatase-like HAD superfamily hydrolase
MRVALFDIDGTLLDSLGAGRRAMEAALVETFGTPGPADYRYDGKTDRQIVREQMREAGHDDAAIDARMDEVFARYLAGLADEVAAGTVRRLAGVAEVLDALEPREDVVLGLLTGNVAEGAAVKLRAAGLAVERFVVCAYGSDHESRLELPGIARQRAVRRLGRDVGAEQLVIIGDTPLDIACAHHGGARAVAVGTGHYSVETLAEHAPARVLADLADAERAVEAILRA